MAWSRRLRVAVALSAPVCLFAAKNAAGATFNANGTVQIQVAFRYPPPQSDIDLLKAQLDRTALILCDATDTQVKITKVRITGADGSQETGDVWILPQDGRSNSGKSGGHVQLYHNNISGDVIAHELGHYLFGLGDGYDEQNREGGACGIGPAFDRDVRIDETWNTLMQQTGWQWCRDPVNMKLPSDYSPDWPNFSCRSDSDCGMFCTAPGCPVDGAGMPLNWGCPSPPPLFHEYDVSMNNDLRRGTGNVCPVPKAGAILVVNAKLEPSNPTELAGGLKCGNNKVDDVEECDGADLAGKTCVDLGFAAGAGLGCYPNCTFDTSGCKAQPVCGNGFNDPGEACDVFFPDPSVTCAKFGFTQGPTGKLTCDPNCGINTSQCANSIAVSSPSTTLLADEQAKARLSNEFTVFDTLGNLKANSSDNTGLSNHGLWVFVRHLLKDQWQVDFAVPGKEYVGGPKDDIEGVKTVRLTFSGSALTAIDGGSPNTPVTIELGGSKTGAFVAAADGTVAPALTLAVRMKGILQQTWLQPWGATGGSKFDSGTGVFAAEPGSVGQNQIGKCGDDNYCKKIWNQTTQRFETTDQTNSQSIIKSDWEVLSATLATKGVAISLPAGGFPSPATPSVAACGGAVTYDVAVTSPDQIMMVVDRSGSMSTPIKSINGAGETRLAFAQAGARALVSLEKGAPTDLGLVSFNTAATTDQALSTVSDATPSPPAPTVTSKDFDTKIAGLVAGGNTAIGTALSFAETQLMAVPGKTRAVVLLSDGENNSGTVSPHDAATKLASDGIAVFTVPVGDSADRILMSDLANTTSGNMLDAPIGDELPPLFAEVYARSRSESLVIERTPFVVAQAVVIPRIAFQSRASAAAAAPIPQSASFDVPVEFGAGRLNLMLSTRNTTATSWDPVFTLTDPLGNTVLTNTDPSVVRDTFFRVMTISAPATGTWKLVVSAPSTVPQYTYLLAHVEDPGPDCFAAVSTLRAQDNAPVTVTARGYYASSPLDAGLTFTGTMNRPDGTSVPLVFQHSQNADLGDTAVIDPSMYAGRGIYDITVGCQVSSAATYAAGESTFASTQVTFQNAKTFPIRPDAPVPAFSRQTRTAFYLFSSSGSSLPPALAGCTSLASCSGIAVGPGGSRGAGGGGTGSFGLFANGLLQIGDHATVQDPDGTPTTVANEGSQFTELEDSAQSGDVWSQAKVELDSNAIVFGGVTTGATLSEDNGARVTGSISEHATLAFPDLHAFKVSFPQTNQGDVLALPGPTKTLAPGSYGNVNVSTWATLKLQAGVYYAASFNLGALANLQLDTSSGAVYLYVKTAFTDLGSIAQMDHRHDRFFLGYFGSLSVAFVTPFSGTLVAPSAALLLGGTGSHAGSFFAQSIVVGPHGIVQHVPFAQAWVGPGVTTLSVERDVGLTPASESEIGAAPAPPSDNDGGCAITQSPSRARYGFGVLALSALGAGLARRRRCRTGRDQAP